LEHSQPSLDQTPSTKCANKVANINFTQLLSQLAVNVSDVAQRNSDIKQHGACKESKEAMHLSDIGKFRPTSST
jgi:hypothetical protein